MDRTECEHGHLRRKCPICALEEELAAERERAEEAEAACERYREALLDRVFHPDKYR